MELLKLALIFVLILIFLGIKKPLYLVMAGASVLLGLLFAMPAADWLRVVGRSMLSPGTLEVLFIIWSVMLLEGLMGENGYLDRMMRAVDQLFRSRRVSLISMPMLIGFLPSAGGALFSAPLVDTAAQGLDLSPERKAQINVYYRHIMEIFFPTYPATIVICNIAQAPLGSFALLTLPVALLALVLGLIMVKDVRGGGKREKAGNLGRRLSAFVLALWPFLLLLALIMVFKAEVYIACFASLLAVMVATKMKPREFLPLVKTKTKWRLLLMALTVMVFKDVLLGCGAVDALPQIIAQLPIPPLVVFSLMSLFIGMITGVTFSSSAITMPLVIAALPGYTLPMVAFIHLSSYVGCQLTPTHLCISISAEYFKANLEKVIAGYAPYYLAIYAVSYLAYGLWLG